MNKTLLIALASIFAASSAAAAGLGHGAMMARDGITARHDASTMLRKSKGADDVGIDNRHGKRSDDLVFKRKGTDNPPGDVRQGRGQDDAAGDDRRDRRGDDPAGHH